MWNGLLGRLHPFFLCFSLRIRHPKDRSCFHWTRQKRPLSLCLNKWSEDLYCRDIRNKINILKEFCFSCQARELSFQEWCFNSNIECKDKNKIKQIYRILQRRQWKRKGTPAQEEWQFQGIYYMQLPVPCLQPLHSESISTYSHLLMSKL